MQRESFCQHLPVIYAEGKRNSMQQLLPWSLSAQSLFEQAWISNLSTFLVTEMCP